ncbi:MAG: hypothetical protein MUF54_09325 [Polyangiaceae bacterium]|jgi:hypothetical protein|nr:hypothetical protein [Polyangiaceae bacterium]
MKTASSRSLLVWATALTLGGCAAQTGPDQDISSQTDSEVSARTDSFVSIRKDVRKCASPLCGGYFVRDLNQSGHERYVSTLDFAAAALDDVSVAEVLKAPQGDIVLSGKLGRKEKRFGTRPFLVASAYRGMPGVRPDSSDLFYAAQERSPRITCITAPCPNQVATKLNTSERSYFDKLNIMHAAKPAVDKRWLRDRVQGHEAVVAAHFAPGEQFPGGREKVLDISQVFIKLPDTVGPCPMTPIPACEAPLTATFTRNADRCLIFDACVNQTQCPMIKPPVCADGYELVSWQTNTTMCRKFVCDPAFLTDQPEPEPGFCASVRCQAGHHCSEQLRACLPDGGFDAAMLVGAWEATAMSDSGNPAEPVPPGQGFFTVFRSNGTLALGCGEGAPSGTWKLDPSASVIKVALGDGSVQLDWTLASLSQDDLAFGEGGDIFYFRRTTCP